jgi:outer membrane protein TolC
MPIRPLQKRRGPRARSLLMQRAWIVTRASSRVGRVRANGVPRVSLSAAAEREPANVAVNSALNPAAAAGTTYWCLDGGKQTTSTWRGARR